MDAVASSLSVIPFSLPQDGVLLSALLGLVISAKDWEELGEKSSRSIGNLL